MGNILQQLGLLCTGALLPCEKEGNHRRLEPENPMSGPEDQEDIGAEDCGRPCPPEMRRDCCVEYWARMVAEGFWDANAHRWTAKGIKEMTK